MLRRVCLCILTVMNKRLRVTRAGTPQLSSLHTATQTGRQPALSLAPSPAEVSACLWADRRLAAAIVSAVDGEDGGDVRADGLPDAVSVSTVSADGALSDDALPLDVLLRRAPDAGPDLERVSTGTKFALELWLKRLETPDP